MRKIGIYTGLVFVLLCMSSCHVGRFVYWNFANITDYKKFPYQTARKSSAPFRFAYKPMKEVSISLYTKKNPKGAAQDLGLFLQQNKTVAFLIIRNDSILYENYFHGYDSASVTTSFSVAKSFVSTLVGIAIAEGKIQSVDDPIVKYLPELKNPGMDKITIEHVLNMQSGIDFKESYTNPFGDAAKYYYGLNLKRYVAKMKVKEAPGKRFGYISGNTQLLGMIVERATQKPLTQYLEEKIWQPLGMEYDAMWSVDSRKHQEIKAYCCINARAHDFAKFGRLYLNNGNWNGKQILPESWVSHAGGKLAIHRAYNYQWWKGPGTEYGARGILGQYIYLVPAKNIIMVRLGTSNNGVNWPMFLHNLAEGL